MVLFPVPLSPTIATVSPGWISNDTSSRVGAPRSNEKLMCSNRMGASNRGQLEGTGRLHDLWFRIADLVDPVQRHLGRGQTGIEPHEGLNWGE